MKLLKPEWIHLKMDIRQLLIPFQVIHDYQYPRHPEYNGSANLNAILASSLFYDNTLKYPNCPFNQADKLENLEDVYKKIMTSLEKFRS